MDIERKMGVIKRQIHQIDHESLRSEISKSILEGQPSLNRIAEAVGVSSRTLQRYLAQSDLTFSNVVDEMRFLTARGLIIKHYKLRDIAHMLGYADASSFTRAFRRWTGMSPRKYRQQFSRC